MIRTPIPFFDIITFDENFIVEYSETSDSQTYAIPTIETQTTSDDTNIQIHDPKEILSATSESQVQCPQQDPQTTQPMIQQQPNIQLENFSLPLRYICRNELARSC